MFVTDNDAILLFPSRELTNIEYVTFAEHHHFQIPKGAH
jgi:hypothetical protein